MTTTLTETPVDVAAAVRRARDVAAWWWRLGPHVRGRALMRWVGVLGRRSPEISAVMRLETGKSDADATIELLATVEHLRWAAANAGRLLRRRRVPGTWLLPELRTELSFEPYGVVGVIGPWNFPVMTPMGAIGSALAAGNAVVFKPSEHSPTVGRLLAETCEEAMRGAPLLQAVEGGADVGAALVTSGVDKIAFTGSPGTAAKVLEAAAPTLTPVSVEGGGKDPAIVLPGADIDAAAEAVLWGAMYNSGQACIGIERAYVCDDVYEPFVRALVEKAERLTVGRTGDLGPIMVPAQLDVIRAHITDALDLGARAVVGGLDGIDPPYVSPTILIHVAPEAVVLREETFGPVLPVVRAIDAEDAITRAESGRYGLGAAVFGPVRQARAVAARLSCGMVSINSTLAFAGQPWLPFGGRRDSGSGRVHAEAGLHEFALPKSVVVRRGRHPLELTTYERGKRALPFAEMALRRIYGSFGRSG